MLLQSLLKEGTVVLDGVKMPLSELQGDVTFEQDMLIGELTVKESLRAALNLKALLNKEEVGSTLMLSTAVAQLLSDCLLEP